MSLYEKVTKTYPYPIAYRRGRISRATNDEGRLDQILKCAEVIDRYLAALSIASFAARNESDAEIPAAFIQFDKNLNYITADTTPLRIPLAVLKSEAARTKFREILDWFVQQGVGKVHFEPEF